MKVAVYSSMLSALSSPSPSLVNLLWKSFALSYSLYCSRVSRTENLPNITQQCNSWVEDGNLEVSLRKVGLKIILFKHSLDFCTEIAD